MEASDKKLAINPNMTEWLRSKVENKVNHAFLSQLVV